MTPGRVWRSVRAVTNMRAVLAAEAGGPDVLRLTGVAAPVAGEGQLLVRVEYTGVNFADVLMRRGESASPFPLVPGVEGAGVVVEAGPGAEAFAPGDRVAWSPVKGHSSIGSYAELAVVDAGQAMRVPDDISLETAAAVILQGLTAHYLVHDIAPVGPGTTVLVHAGAGGTGRTVVRWASQLGAEVFATVGTEDKARVATAAGATHVIRYRDTDFADEVLRITGGRGVDYIVDGVGAGTIRGDLRAVAERGHICVFGRAGGVPERFSPLELVWRSISVSGGYMTNYLRTPEEIARRVDDVWAGVRAGWLAPLVQQVHPLADASVAHAALEGRDSTGKLVLAV